MEIGVDISLYPLATDFIPPILDVIERLKADGRVKVVTNSLSTQVFGRYEDVFELLQRELRTTFENNDKSVFVMKMVGPLPGGGG